MGLNINYILLIGAACLFSSCGNETSDNPLSDNFYNIPYVMSKKDSILEKHYKTDLLEYIKDDQIDGFGTTYAPQNIIFYGDKIYIHLNRVWVSWCATGIEYGDVRFLDLQPDNLLAVPKEHLIEFIELNYEENIENLHGFSRSYAIASDSDTINNSIFPKLAGYSRKTKTHFFIRRITEEESNVLDAKTKKIYYDKEKYTWKRKYINDKIEFLPPD